MNDAKENKLDLLKDEIQYYNLDGLNDVSTSWSSSVSSANLDSINVTGTFSPLISNGVAVGFFNSLDSSIKAIEVNIKSISTAILSFVSQQNHIDEKGKDYIKDSPRYKGGGGSYSGGGSSQGYSETEEKELDDSIKNDFVSYVNSLDDYTNISLIYNLLLISKNDLKSLIFNDNEEFGNEINVILVNLFKNGNISSELKAKILDLGTREKKTLLKYLLTSGKNISDFSKKVFTSINYKITESNAVTTAQNFIETFQKVSFDNIQVDINNIYEGNGGSSVNEQTVKITKGMVDEIAKMKGVSSKEILTNKKYADELRDASYDLIKSYINIYAIGSNDKDALMLLSKNLKI